MGSPFFWTRSPAVWSEHCQIGWLRPRAAKRSLGSQNALQTSSLGKQQHLPLLYCRICFAHHMCPSQQAVETRCRCAQVWTGARRADCQRNFIPGLPQGVWHLSHFFQVGQHFWDSRSLLSREDIPAPGLGWVRPKLCIAHYFPSTSICKANLSAIVFTWDFADVEIYQGRQGHVQIGEGWLTNYNHSELTRTPPQSNKASPVTNEPWAHHSWKC
jgi:hypothetical protein